MAESTEQAVVLDNIPLDVDVGKILAQMKIHGDSKRYENGVRAALESLRPVARPKALYKVGCVENKTGETLEIDGVTFTSQLVTTNLDKIDSVFVCVVTVGTEVESVPQPADVFQRFCQDAAKNAFLFTASTYLADYLKKRYHIRGQITRLNPGETASFPIDQQRNLFAILGEVQKLIGVTLTENCALVPVKSHSGIYYSSETEFISCRLCTNQRCMGRRAAYEPALARTFTK